MYVRHRHLVLSALCLPLRRSEQPRPGSTRNDGTHTNTSRHRGLVSTQQLMLAPNYVSPEDRGPDTAAPPGQVH